MSSRKIEDLTPEMQSLYAKFKTRMAQEGLDYIVTCTFRSQEEQDRLYAQGRTIPGTKVTWAKHSRHTEREAFDIAMMVDGKITWETKYYEKAVKVGLEVGLNAGGDWTTNKDYPHFEYKHF